MSWQYGLQRVVADASNYLISSPTAVVIKDKFPKAAHHYLVLPRNNIDSIFNLTKCHLELLDEMYLLGINIIETTQRRTEDFKMGFHVQPSMKLLHMHVISKDFHSPCLKTKQHWNSFNTNYLIPFDVLYEDLKSNGRIKPLGKDQITDLLKTELRCNQCDYKPVSVPNLKYHLLEHWLEKNEPLPE